MLGYSQSQEQWEIVHTTVGNCTHCCISYSEEIKYIVDNSLSIGKAGEYSHEQTKKKVTKVLQPFCS